MSNIPFSKIPNYKSTNSMILMALMINYQRNWLITRMGIKPTSDALKNLKVSNNIQEGWPSLQKMITW